MSQCLMSHKIDCQGPPTTQLTLSHIFLYHILPILPVLGGAITFHGWWKLGIFRFTFEWILHMNLNKLIFCNYIELQLQYWYLSTPTIIFVFLQSRETSKDALLVGIYEGSLPSSWLVKSVVKLVVKSNLLLPNFAKASEIFLQQDFQCFYIDKTCEHLTAASLCSDYSHSSPAWAISNLIRAVQQWKLGNIPIIVAFLLPSRGWVFFEDMKSIFVGYGIPLYPISLPVGVQNPKQHKV